MRNFNHLRRRGSPRYKTELTAFIMTPEAEFSGRLIDISGGGACVEIAPSVTMMLESPNLSLRVDNLVTAPCKRMWQKTNRVGLKFQINNQRMLTIATRLRQFAATSDAIWVSSD